MSSLIDKAKHMVSGAVTGMEKPEASVKDVDLKGVSLGHVTYNAKIIVTNPCGVSIPICEIRYILKSNGSEIATGTLPDPGSLKGNDDTLLDVEMKVPHSVLVSLVKDITRDWDIDYDLQVDLVVDLPLIGEFTIPINNKGEVKLPSLSDYWK
uniref:desiccation protectant protein Lea14 homolog n=1 Tax=Erigeron canadensis TaxID=72917 RepID=UPI001CB88EFE|nr:desiccation protectant protein Lea14 homolog [Erigeron canadensis]